MANYTPAAIVTAGSTPKPVYVEPGRYYILCKYRPTSHLDDVPSLPTVRITGVSSARITNLKPMTYYKVTIRGVAETNLGPSTSIR